MNPTTLTIIIVLAVIAIIALIAWLLRKSGFTVTEIKAKVAGLLEVKAERPSPNANAAEKTPPIRTEVKQKASDGGVIRKSGVKAPADAGAKTEQEAKGEGSKIDDSPIELS